MDSDCLKWFMDNNLENFINIFEQNGFEDLDSVSMVTEQDLRETMNIPQLGQRKKIMAKLELLKSRQKQTSLFTDLAQPKPNLKSYIQKSKSINCH